MEGRGRRIYLLTGSEELRSLEPNLEKPRTGADAERRTATAAAAAAAGDDGKESALLALPLPLPPASSESVLRSGTNSEPSQIQLCSEAEASVSPPTGTGMLEGSILQPCQNLHIIPEISK